MKMDSKSSFASLMHACNEMNGVYLIIISVLRINCECVANFRTEYLK